jgi:hypothetical protein
MRRAAALLLAACTAGDIGALDQPCGPNGECPAGYVCDPGPNRCIVGRGLGAVDAPAPDATVDAALAAAPDAAWADAPVGPVVDAAAPAQLVLEPASHDFGAATLGATTLPVPFMVTNRGGTASGAVSAVVSDPSSFAISDTTCAGPLGPGASCTVDVVFAPTLTAGPKSALLTVAATPGGMAEAMLSGAGLTPGQLTITPPRSDLGKVALGAAPNPVPFTVTNTGQSTTGALAVTLLAASGFQLVANGCTAGLGPGAQCVVQVAFVPTAVGSVQGTLMVSGDPGGAAAASVTGTGTARVKVTGVSGGMVTSAPGGIRCPTACAATFSSAPVTLVAAPDATHTFAGWSGACMGTGACVLPLDVPQTTVGRRSRPSRWRT